MDAREVQRLIEEYGHSEAYEEVADYGQFWDDFYYEKQSVEIPDLGTIQKVKADGAEGDGAEMWVVFSLGDQLFRMTGSYSSWDSNYWDSRLEEVESYVEPTTYFRRKK